MKNNLIIRILCCVHVFIFSASTSTASAQPNQIKAIVPIVNPIDIKVESPLTLTERKKYIVETENADVLANIKAHHPTIKLDKVFDTVFQGAAMIGTKAEIAKIKQEQGVKQIHETSIYKVELDDSVPFIGGMLVRGEFDEKNQRLTGKGVKVGVIDTGIDYTHPDIIRNYRGGFDLVDEDEDPMETVKSEGEATMHGTHVAGIIGANGKYLGVAPDAEIYAYRALGPGGYGTTDQVIAAIEKAVEDGMDIINLSLGSSVNGPDYPTSVALDHAVEKGVIAVTSNGNSGPALWSVGSPGTSEKAISVGASTPPLEIPVLQLELVPNRAIMLQPLQGSIPWNVTKSQKLVFAKTGKKENLANVKDKIVLVERGGISFTEKVRNAYEKGARAVLIFNHEKGLFTGALEEAIEIPVVALSREDGLFLKKELKNGHEWVVTKAKKVNDKLANFSSRGPVTHTWKIKPDVVAPGVKIDSPVPDGYVALQGTSMAAPHVAGAAALLKQAHPDWSPDEVKAALMNTAKPIYDDSGKLYNPYEQGAGRIQVEKAINAEVLAYPGALAFGSVKPKSGMIEKSLKVMIANKGNKSQKITFNFPEYEKGVKWKLPLSTYVKPHEKKQLELSVMIDTKIVSEGIHHGRLAIQSTSKQELSLPYLFIVGDARHPRVMGFSFEKEDGLEDTYKYELYLPEGADELGIALFDPTTLKYIGLLKHEHNVKRGLLEVVQKREDIPFEDGEYVAIVYAIENGKQSVQESTITIGLGKHENRILK